MSSNPLRLLAIPLCLAALHAQEGKGKLDFQAAILPILQTSCFDCHRSAHTDDGGRLRRPKGGVALDSKQAILRGKQGRRGNQPLFTAGKPEQSLIVEVVTLPADDEDHMPPADKKDPLTEAQVKLLKQWIAEGGEFGSWIGAPAAAAADAGPGGADPMPRADVLAPLAKGLKPLADDVLQKAAGQKARIEPMADGSPLLRVSFPGHEDELADADLQALQPLAGHVAVLDLGRSKVGDGAAAAIGKMQRLLRLDLRETAAGDATVKALAALPELRWLNLYGTRITDKALDDVAKMPKLERLYVWQTGVTPEAVAKLEQVRPKLQVVATAQLPEGERGGEGRRGRRGRGR